MADLAEISQSTIVKYEEGATKISKDINTVLSEIFNIDTSIDDQADLATTSVRQLTSCKEKNILTNKQLIKKLELMIF